ncbi:MAG: hypothetical protein NTV97_22810 [Alphaproteobacteria bacterium]|nr:hypothetical protein [Alphaproteobacteria bacterium]
MADIAETTEMVRDHRRTFVAFERLILFAVLHIVLSLACVALAFVGHEKLLAFLLWTGGTIAMIVGFAISAGYSTHE